MSETNHSSGEGVDRAAEISLPPQIREEYVRVLIQTLQEVATGERRETYTELPLLLGDNIELAHLLTDARQTDEVVTESGQKIVYHKGAYGNESLEFATRYESGKTDDTATAWGVRRTFLEARKYPHVPAVRLSPAALDIFVAEVLEGIEGVEVVPEAGSRMAA